MSSPGEGGGRLGLTEVSTDDLKQLLEALHSGALRAPLSAIALDHAGFGFLKPARSSSNFSSRCEQAVTRCSRRVCCKPTRKVANS